MGKASGALASFCAAFLFLLSAPALAADVDVSVPTELGANVSAFSYQDSDLSRMGVEFYNTGSAAYAGRVKVEVLDGEGGRFVGWSRQAALAPGERTALPVYWYSDSAGGFTAAVTYYFGDMSSRREFEVEKSSSGPPPEDAFEVCCARAYRDRVVLEVRALRDASGVVVMPSSFPVGWVFEQAQLGDMRAGSSRTVSLGYHGAVLPGEAEVIVASDSGRLASRQRFALEERTGPAAFLQALLDSLLVP